MDMRVDEMRHPALQRFRDYLPYNPYCSRSKRLEYIQDKEAAASFPYVQINYPIIRYVVFDLDYAGSALAASDHELPHPTLAVVNRENGHSHCMYELLKPLPRKHSRSTRLLLRDVTGAYGDILCADKCITTQKQLVKNPLHIQWDVICPTGYGGVFTLSELAEYIPVEWKRARDNTRKFPATRDTKVRTFEETYNPISRNCSLFENGRYYAYSIVCQCSSYDELYGHVLDWIGGLNETKVPRYFPAKLPYSELRSIARSIASWTYDHRTSFMKVDVNEGAMGFPSMKGTVWTRGDYQREVRRRRRLAAKRTNEVRREATKRKIADAVEQCRGNGLEPSARVVSELSGVPLRTVYNYKELL
jgi:hypothetical protein